MNEHVYFYMRPPFCAKCVRSLPSCFVEKPRFLGGVTIASFDIPRYSEVFIFAFSTRFCSFLLVILGILIYQDFLSHSMHFKSRKIFS